MVTVRGRRRKLLPARRHLPPILTSTSPSRERKAPPAWSRCVVSRTGEWLISRQTFVLSSDFRDDTTITSRFSQQQKLECVLLLAGVRGLGQLQTERHAGGLRHPVCEPGSQCSGRRKVRHVSGQDFPAVVMCVFWYSLSASTQRRLLVHPGPDGVHGDRRGAESAQPAGLSRPPPPHALRQAAAAQQPPAALNHLGGQQCLWGQFFFLLPQCVWL